MKKTSVLVLASAAILALASCAPQAFVVSPEMRCPSKSGLNLAGKSMAVVYLTDGNPRSEAFNASAAAGFAGRLESDYFGGAQEIELFTARTGDGVEYASKDSLVSLVLETGKDVVFLMDIPELGIPAVKDPVKVVGEKMPADSAYISTASIPFTTKIFVYDSMDKEDRVRGFSGTRSFNVEIYNDGKTSKEQIIGKVWKNVDSGAEKAGFAAAASFLSTWKADEFYVIYYDASERAWDTGAEYAYASKWKEAIGQWMTLLQCSNTEKKACAAYNIALGCFMSGQPALAIEWLDRSDSYMPVSLSTNLRTKITYYTGQ
jgi:hypothetical protein